MLLRANYVVESKDVTWEAPSVQKVPPPATPEDLTHFLDSDDDEPAVSRPQRLPFVGRGIPHQLRTIPQTTEEEQSEDDRSPLMGFNETDPINDTSPIRDAEGTGSDASSAEARLHHRTSNSQRIQRHGQRLAN